MSLKILAQYTDTSTFEVPENIDISNAYKLDIEWDVLYIQEKADSPMIEIKKKREEPNDKELYRTPNKIILPDSYLDEHGNWNET